jgi:anti-sigma factor RsiW
MSIPPLPPDTPAEPDDWAAQREALRGLHRDVLAEPVPPALQAAARRLAHHHMAIERRARWATWGAMAAAVFVAFGVGWVAHAQWQARPASAIARAPAAQNFVRDAAAAYVVYSPEKRHPVEVAASEQQHLVQWLSRRLDRPLKVPDLSAQGYALVGGRLLPGDDGARAQFMFENAAGQRVTLYLGALDDKATPSGRSKQETAFSFASSGAVPSFYWVDRGFGYALSAPLPRDALLMLATEVYRQL